MLYFFNLKSLICNFFFDPLDQFDVFSFSSGIALTNLLYFFIFLLLLIILPLHFTDAFELKKTNWNFFTLLRIQLFSFVENISNANIILPKQFFILIYYFAFLFILGANIIGLIPFSFTITSSFIITFSFSLILFLIINILAIYRIGFFPFIGMFMPSGTPLQIGFLLVIIEIVSYIARLFSLSIRLFANMMAGHTLLKILIGFSFSILFSFTSLIPFAIVPWIIVTCIVVLEILISMLQAYVFLILICIYCNDIVLDH